MDVICLESEALKRLIDRTVQRVLEAHDEQREPRWIDTDRAKELLSISSNTTLQKLRDEGKIRYSQPMHKVILYDRESILEYIEHHAKDTF